MSLAFTDFDSGSSTANANSYSLTSKTYTAGRAYFFLVHLTGASDVSLALSGLTFTEVGRDTGLTTNTNIVAVFCATVASNTTGQVVVTATGGGTALIWQTLETTGHNNTVPYYNFNNTSGFASGSTNSVILNSFLSSSDGTIAFQGWDSATTTYSAESGYTAGATQTQSTPACAAKAEWRISNDTTPSFTLTGGNAAYSLVAFEVLASGVFPVTTHSGSLTANAVIKKTASSSLTATSVLKKTGSATFTANSMLQLKATGTFTVDAYIANDKSFTADAMLMQVGTGSFTADSNIQDTITGSFTANAVIEVTVSGSFTADAYIQRGPSQFTADAVIAQPMNKYVITADAYIVRLPVEGVIAADAVILSTILSSFTADAYIQLTTTFMADAVLQDTFQDTFTMDAYIGIDDSGFSAVPSEEDE